MSQTSTQTNINVKLTAIEIVVFIVYTLIFERTTKNTH